MAARKPNGKNSHNSDHGSATQSSITDRYPTEIDDLPFEEAAAEFGEMELKSLKIDEQSQISATSDNQGERSARPYVDGESRIVLIKHEGKDCFATLVTEAMVASINQIKKDSQAVAKKEDHATAAEMEALQAEENIENLTTIDLKGAATHAEAEKLRLEIRRQQLDLEKAQEWRDSVRGDVEILKSSLESLKDVLQLMFETVLEEGSLLDPPDIDDAQISEDDAKLSENISILSADNGSVEPNWEELLRCTAIDVQQSQWRLREYQQRFDDRQADYKQELEHYSTLKMEEKINCIRTDHDCFEIDHARQLTRDLIDAEETHRAAKLRAKALGLRQNVYGQFSAFGGSADDGYTMSQEVSATAHVDRSRIESWLECVQETQSDIQGQVVQTVHAGADVDNWDARSVKIDDSGSVLDNYRYVEELNGWKKQCRDLREHLNRQEKEIEMCDFQGLH